MSMEVTYVEHVRPIDVLLPLHSIHHRITPKDLQARVAIEACVRRREKADFRRFRGEHVSGQGEALHQSSPPFHPASFYSFYFFPSRAVGISFPSLLFYRPRKEHMVGFGLRWESRGCRKRGRWNSVHNCCHSGSPQPCSFRFHSRSLQEIQEAESGWPVDHTYVFVETARP
jgi:hypothetical protein